MAGKLDLTDLKILDVLVENGRLSFREVARRLGASVATVASRVSELEKDGVVRGYSCRLDYERMGFDLSVIISFRIQRGKLLELERKVASLPNVFAVYDCTGDWDAVVLARFENRRELDKFVKHVQTLDFVERTNTVLVLNTVKESFVSPLSIAKN